MLLKVTSIRKDWSVVRRECTEEATKSFAYCKEVVDAVRQIMHTRLYDTAPLIEDCQWWTLLFDRSNFPFWRMNTETDQLATLCFTGQQSVWIEDSVMEHQDCHQDDHWQHWSKMLFDESLLSNRIIMMILLLLRVVGVLRVPMAVARRIMNVSDGKEEWSCQWWWWCAKD